MQLKTLTRSLLTSVLFTCLCALTMQTANAQCAIGQTEVILDVAIGSFPAEQSWELIDDVTGLPIASAACGTITASTSDTLCLNDGQTYTFNAFDDWGDGWNGGSFTVTKLADGCEITTGLASDGLAGDGTDICDASSLEESSTFQTDAAISGCTDPSSTNYNICATVDDGSCLFPAVNDACADAIDIPSGTCFSGTNTGATFGGDTLDIACVDGSVTPNDIWFTTTVPAGGSVTVELPVVPGFSSIFEFYTGDCAGLGAGVLASLGACNNYSAGGGITLSGLTAGSVLYIRYWDFGSDQEGPVEVCVSEPGSGCTDPCASNYDTTATVDDGSCILPTAGSSTCAGATVVTAGTHYVYVADDTATVDITSCTFNDVNAAWYAYTVPAGLDTLNINTCGSSYDTGLSLWDACGGTEIACNDDGQIYPDPSNPTSTSSCGGSAFQSAIQLTDTSLSALVGSTIYIRVAGYNDASGCGDLIIEEIATPVAVCNAPTGLAAAYGPAAGQTTLTWDATAGALGYRIYGGPVANPVFKRQSSANLNKVPTTCGEEYTYRVRVLCADGTKSNYSAAYNFTAGCPRIGEIITAEIFPNPASETALVQFEAALEEVVTLELIDITGKVVNVSTMNTVAGMNQQNIEVSNLSAGTYFVQINGEETTLAIQFEVAH